MPSLLLLARRDLRLYPDLFLLPLGAILAGGLVGFWSSPIGWGFSVFIVVLSPLLVHAAHLREEAYGTLPELALLPITPFQMALYRALQAAALMLTASTLAYLLGLPAMAPGEPIRMLKDMPYPMSWYVVILGLLPLPITLRFGKKGWQCLLLTLGALGLSLFTVQFLPASLHPAALRLGMHVLGAMDWISRSHTHQILTLLGLAALCVALGAFGIRRRSL